MILGMGEVEDNGFIGKIGYNFIVFILLKIRFLSFFDGFIVLEY